MKCSYCSSEIKKGEGVMYVYNNGTIRYYCSARCQKNEIMKRTFNKKESRRNNPVPAPKAAK